MGVIDDVLRALDRIPIWKRVQALPDTVAALEARIAALEAKLSGKTGIACPICNSPGFMRTGSKRHPIFGDAGLMLDTWTCPACSHSEEREREVRDPQAR